MTASRIKTSKLVEWAAEPQVHVDNDRFRRVCNSHIAAEREIDALTQQRDAARREAATLRQALSSIHGKADDALSGRPDMTGHIG